MKAWGGGGGEGARPFVFFEGWEGGLVIGLDRMFFFQSSLVQSSNLFPYFLASSSRSVRRIVKLS